MVKGKWVLVFALLAGLACTGSALAALYEEFFPPSADGSQNTWISSSAQAAEGYAIAGDGQFRAQKWDQHFPYWGFDIEGDGPNGIPTGDEPDNPDGQLLGDWLADKKMVRVAFYVRDRSAGYCANNLDPGSYLQEPGVVLAFRAGNTGQFNDRSINGPVCCGCCGTYDDPLVEGGENAPPAWRIGVPTDSVNGIYSWHGDIGEPGTGTEGSVTPEYWKVSNLDSTNPGLEVYSNNPALMPQFDPDGDGFEGFSGWVVDPETNDDDAMFALEYLIRHSDAQLISSYTLDITDCTDDSFGVPEPRMIDGLTDPYGVNTPADPLDDDWVGGWYGLLVDRKLVKAIGAGGDTKGLVISAIGATDVPTGYNALYDARDQSGGDFEAYLHVLATLPGDVSNDGCVDVFDVIDTVNAFGSAPGDPNWNVEADFDLNDLVDVFDVIAVVNNFGNCVQ